VEPDALGKKEVMENCYFIEQEIRFEREGKEGERAETDA